MLRSLIAFCLSRRLLVMVAFGAFLGLGYAAFLMLNIEAYPDPAPPIIEIIAQQQGQSPEEVERYITIPIEVAVACTPGLKFIRSNTVYGLGFIRLQFEYGRDYHFVRQQTLNRLKDAVLPAGVLPVISPAGGISEIFRYELMGPPGMDVMRLKALQDWVVERKLRIVPGVADVAVLGGKTKEFQAEINLDRMMAHGLTLPQIMTAISAGNSNVGGRTIAIGEQSVNVRSIGVITSMDDIGNIVLTQQGGVPVLVSDVAKVQIGFAPRLGLAGRDDKTDVVTGIVLMQKLERTMEVVKRVRIAVERINTDGSLPPGVKIVTFYDRGDLVAITVQTVLHNLLFGVALIFLIQWVFLGDLRCALIVAATIPVALFLAVMITVMRGKPPSESLPPRVSIETTTASACASRASARKRGSRSAAVPITTRAAPASKAVASESPSRRPPPSWTGQSTEATIRRTASRLTGAPALAPSRSTTWRISAPSSAQRRAASAGSAS